MAETTANEILDRLSERINKDDPKVQVYLAALREKLEAESQDAEANRKALAEFEEVYAKLTAPANRIGTFVRSLDSGRALVSLGDTEYVTEVDPGIMPEGLVMGVRVRVNEAFAVIGIMDDSQAGQLVRVSLVLEDGRIKIGGEAPGSDGKLVQASAAINILSVRSGDEIRLDPTGKVALEHFPKEAGKDYFAEDIPETPWEAVGGQEKAIKLIRDTIEQPLLHPELYKAYDKKPVKGILLYGPPGCGKTLIGKATAYNLTQEYSKRVGHKVEHYFMAISGPKILNMWLGETERMVREIFATAREKAKEGRLVFIFMDEAESVLRTRSSGRWMNISNTVVPQFCAELDGLVELENVVLMLTSNRPDYIDPAVMRPERIDRKVKISRPDRAASQQILGIYLHDRIPLDPTLMTKFSGEVDCVRKEMIEDAIEFLWDARDQSAFVHLTLRNGLQETLYWKDMVSGALLKSVVDRAKDAAIRRAIANPEQKHGVTVADLTQAVEAEYKENEIFPKSDSQEDWLQLLDYSGEEIAAVRPIQADRGGKFARKGII